MYLLYSCPVCALEAVGEVVEGVFFWAFFPRLRSLRLRLVSGDGGPCLG